jgi:urea transporter
MLTETQTAESWQEPWQTSLTGRRTRALTNTLRFWVDSTLRSYANILFSDRKFIGLLAFLATFINLKAGFFGVTGIFSANMLAHMLGVNEDKIRKGFIGFNALLLGLSYSYYYALTPTAVVILFVSVGLLVFVNIALDHIFNYFFNLPALSIPFVLVSTIGFLAFYNYDGTPLHANTTFAGDAYFPQLPRYMTYYLKSLGAIFFQTSLWAGLLVLIALVAASRLSFLLSVLGFSTGLAFHILLKGDINDMTGGLVAFNYILTAVAIGGIFLIPTPAAFILAMLATAVTATIASFIKIFFVSFNMPVLTLPFAMTTLLFLYCVRLLYNKKLKPVDFLPGSPEYNLDFYLSRQGRFGDLGIDIRLPFCGNWRVSQGYHGQYTHQSEWYASLDFEALGDGGKSTHRASGARCEDYYTFGLPVLAVATGTVRRVVQHLDDNQPGQMNLRENWGNLVLIEHSTQLYSLVCHLKKNSVLVKEGDYVYPGTKLGLAGNSGRSPEPHLHLHFQATPEIGSATIPVPLSQYVVHNGVSKISFNSVPAENAVVSNLTPDFNLKNFFSIAPGQSLDVKLQPPDHEATLERWEIKIDFLGSRFIENDRGDRLLFSASNDWFAALDYTGSRQSALFILFLAYYRVPFSAAGFSYKERISYKYFSRLPMRIAKDVLLPFTDRVSLSWYAEPTGTTGNLIESRIATGKRTLIATSASLETTFPGVITMKSSGAQWIVSAA